MSPQLYVAGRPITSLAHVGDLIISHEWPAEAVGGPVSAQCSLLLAATERPEWIAKDTAAVVRYGGTQLLAGKLAEPEWSTDPDEPAALTVDGAAREGSSTVCLNAAGMTTSIPDVAVDAAIARGALSWTRPASISNAVLTDGEETAALNNLADMLAAYVDNASETGTRVYVDPWRRLVKTTDPTSPEIFILPGAGELAWAAEAQATRLMGRWANSAGTLATTMVGGGDLERAVDLTTLGPLTANRATTVLTNILARSSSGGWANGLTLTSGQILGRPDLADVAQRVGRGVMMRLLGQPDPRPDRPHVSYIDFIPERSEWHTQSGELIITPRGMVARDFAALLAEYGVQEVTA